MSLRVLKIKTLKLLAKGQSRIPKMFRIQPSMTPQPQPLQNDCSRNNDSPPRQQMSPKLKAHKVDKLTDLNLQRITR
jgi:hypothetical protein